MQNKHVNTIDCSAKMLSPSICFDIWKVETTQFGGEGSQSYFKPKGKEAFLGRVTKIAAVLFFLNALALAVINK